MTEGLHPHAPVLVIAAPSGTGKTTVARTLVNEHPDRFRFSISTTTRAPRGAEKDGIDYHFVDLSRFEELIEEGAFLEWASVHGNRYGTPWSEVVRPSDDPASAPVTVLDIDVQGALQVRERLESATLLFLFPPSGEVLVDRLRRRGTDRSSVIDRRMQGALDELDAVEHFDFVVVNDQLEDTIKTVQAIVTAECARASDMEEVRRRKEELKSEIRIAAGSASRSHTKSDE